MSMNLVTLLYLVASICFIQALKGLSHPTTSIRGNVFGMTGMAIAVLTTAALIVELSGGKAQGMVWVLVGLVVGGGAGAITAQTKYGYKCRYGMRSVEEGVTAINEGCVVLGFGFSELWNRYNASAQLQQSLVAAGALQSRGAELRYAENGQRRSVCGYVGRAAGGPAVGFVSIPNRILFSDDPLPTEFREMRQSYCPGFMAAPAAGEQVLQTFCGT